MITTKPIITYNNGNTKVTIHEDGTKVREYEGTPLPEFPETIDVKITNYCDLGCPWCHEKSTTEGQHGDLKKLFKILDCLPAGVELACLHGDTDVFTPKGKIPIKNMQIGNLVYDQKGYFVKVVNKVKSTKQIVELKFNKGLKIRCTKNHLFLTKNSGLCEADNMVGKQVVTGKLLSKVKAPYIDLQKIVTTKKPGLKGSRGGWYDNKYIRVFHNAPIMHRWLKLTTEVMWLYGITVAEGSSRGISLHKKEKGFALRALKTYHSIINTPIMLNSIVQNGSNGIGVEFKKSSIYRKIFFDKMRIGKGARNKSIKFLFGLDKNLVRSALFGMFQGDGHFRIREHRGIKQYSLQYRTASETLAKELVFLLATVFGVNASFHEGMNKIRFIEGRQLETSNYFSINIYGKKSINKLFPDLYKNNDDFNTIRKYASHTVTPLQCIGIKEIGESSVYDITLEEGSSHLFMIDGGIVTHNCGGGNPLFNPELIPFLRKCKNKGFICNLTINYKQIKTKLNKRLAWMMNRFPLSHITSHNLVKGIGISLPIDNDFHCDYPIMNYTNTVYHVIAGVHDISILDKIVKHIHNPKVLILGYKQFGRGKEYYTPQIEENLKQWKMYLPKYFGKMTISFDNLAIEQLAVKRLFTDEGWEQFYMGDDGSHSMYIDAVKEQFAKTSRSKERFEWKDSNLKDFFKSLQ